MSRLVLLAAVLLFAIGCKPTAPPTAASTAPSEPVREPAPPDDGSPPPRLVKVRTPAESLRDGVAFLVAQQAKDGSWRSDVYATFKDGTALTPLAITALQEAHDAGTRTPEVEAAIKKGCEYLASFTTNDGTLTPPADGFDYPVYTAALVVKALSHPTAKGFARHRDGWVKYIKERQLTGKLGWKPEDREYGGWGYCRVVPKKPEPGAFAPALLESNLSATVFALDALDAAGALDADTQKAAAVFVRRVQNWQPPIPGVPVPWFRHLDGGFHFIYADPVRNKAGAVPKENEHWPQLFHSYGSTTADGVRAITLCGQADDTARRDAARDWLKANFRADRHPGTYVKPHELNRDAVYYYYAASAAHAFREHKLKLPDGRDWAAELTDALARRQQKDGSWSNPVELVRENDPIVATSNAVLALVRCKE